MLQRTCCDCDTEKLSSRFVRARKVLFQIAFWTACASAVSILFSIAVSQVLLGIGILSFLLSGERIRLPRVWVPLALFLLGTLISLLASGDPRIGLPQVRKLFVYLMLPLLFSVLRRVPDACNLLLAWCAVAGTGSVLALFQFVRKWREASDAGRDFYAYYLNGRITGFMSHWMTFSGEQMLVLITLVAFLLFGRLHRRWTIALWIPAGCLMAIALLLSDTRSVWIATMAALVYLTASRKKALALAIPALALVVFLFSPANIKERVVSIVHPRDQVDSNDFRFIVWRTGLRMIEAHPLLGLGPEEVHAQFYRWVPADIPRPLPPGYYGHLHSIYVHYAAERGIPAMLALVWMLGMMLYQCARAVRQIPAGRDDTRFILHASIACVIAILIEGFFELNLGDSEVLTMFLSITACAYVAVADTRTRRAIPVAA